MTTQRHESMSKVFEICYGVKPEDLPLTINSKEAQRFADKFFSTKPETQDKMDPCKEEEHDKVFSGLYQACNPPNWWWICKTCGELGKDNAHVVHPKDVREFARLMVKFRPTEATWWRRFLRDDDTAK